MITGTRCRARGTTTGDPQLLLYACDDLDDWTYLGPLLTIDDPVAAAVVPANIWECPNLFQLGGRWVLLLSQWRHVDGTHELAGVRYLVGDPDRDRGQPAVRRRVRRHRG